MVYYQISVICFFKTLTHVLELFKAEIHSFCLFPKTVYEKQSWQKGQKKVQKKKVEMQEKNSIVNGKAFNLCLSGAGLLVFYKVCWLFIWLISQLQYFWGISCLHFC